MRKKFLSALLLCCMVLTLLPTAALADGDVALTGTVNIIGELKYGKKIYFNVTDRRSTLQVVS